MIQLRRSLNMLVPLLMPALVVLFAATTGYSQVSYDTGTLQGSALDAQGRAVPGQAPLSHPGPMTSEALILPASAC